MSLRMGRRAPLLVVACATASLTLLSAFARQAPPPAPPPGGQGGGPPQGFGPGNFLAPRILEEADADKDGKVSPEEAGKFAEKVVREADAAKKGSVDAAAIGKAINRRMVPPGFEGGEGPPPEDFGPGQFSPRIVEAADTDKDGKVSPEEASRAAEKFVRDGDSAKKGGLDPTALAAAINARMGPPPGMGGPGGPGGGERKVVKKYDRNGDGRLNADERKAAREGLKKDNAGGGRPRFGPPGGFGKGQDEPVAKAGPKVAPSEVKTFAGKPFYDPETLRTLFLDFEDKGWEAEMADFYRTNVELPARLTVDGKKYPGVGVHFRGMSSFFTVREGQKRSVNVSLDYTKSDQRLDGYKTLNLLNSHEDPSFLHSVLYSEIARRYIPAPKVNFVRFVIDGESWGVYINQQQYDKKFLAENFGTEKGARWKVPGNPGADGGLRYLGENVADYKSRFEIKSADDADDWKALIHLCKTLEQTPIDRLEKALEPILDVDGALWFLAIDNALINGDGYWTRGSDYSIYRDPKGKFHLIPHDMNETFGPAMMFGPPRGGGMRGMMGRGPQGKGAGDDAAKKAEFAKKAFGGGGPFGGGGSGKPDLDPLIGLEDARKPMRSRLLAVPSLKAKYLGRVKTIAEQSLDWKTLGPIVAGYRALIEKDIQADTRKLTSFEAFQKAVAEEVPAEQEKPARGRPELSLRAFAEARRAYLLALPSVKEAEAVPAPRR